MIALTTTPDDGTVAHGVTTDQRTVCDREPDTLAEVDEIPADTPTCKTCEAYMLEVGVNGTARVETTDADGNVVRVLNLHWEDDPRDR